MTATTGLSIRLLGKADIAFDGVKLTTLSSRALPLFTILLLSDGPVMRDAIARLLWRRVDVTSALASLRQLLHHLPPPLRAVIHTHRNEMSINHAALAQCDVLIAKDWLAKEPSAEPLLAIYAGALLANQTFDDLPEFDDWLNDQREHFAAKVREVVLAEVISRRQRCKSEKSEKSERPKEDIATTLDLAQACLLLNAFVWIHSLVQR